MAQGDDGRQAGQVGQDCSWPKGQGEIGTKGTGTTDGAQGGMQAAD